jgi:hypothetical protein
MNPNSMPQQEAGMMYLFTYAPPVFHVVPALAEEPVASPQDASVSEAA